MVGIWAGAALAAGTAVWALRAPAIDPQRVYRVGYAHNPPFQIHGADAKPTGFAVEMVQRAAARAGIRLQWIHDRSRTAETLKAGQVDLWPVLADVPERRSWTYVSDTWMLSDHYLISRDASAVARCPSVWVKMTDRYCVPTSLPWRIPCVGSWFSQKARSSCA